jgi:hypothetical protein
MNERLEAVLAETEVPAAEVPAGEICNPDPIGNGDIAPEALSAIVAKSDAVQLSSLPKNFDENLFLSAQFPTDVLEAHASTLTEEEVHDFLDHAAEAADAHGARMVDIIKISAPYILREREFYNKQGQRNAQGKSWTDRKTELASAFGKSLRTFERALTQINPREKLVAFVVNIAGLVEGLEVKVCEDRLPDLKVVAARAQTLAPAGDDEPTVGSPEDLWKLMDRTLKNQVDEVLRVADPTEFASRLREFAQAVADGFFPGTVVDVSPAPGERSEEQ